MTIGHAPNDDVAGFLPGIGHLFDLTAHGFGKLFNDSSAGTPSSVFVPPSISLQDSSLLIYILENAYHWQFRYYPVQNPPFSQDWLLWFITKNKPIYPAVLASRAPQMTLLHSQ